MNPFLPLRALEKLQKVLEPDGELHVVGGVLRDFMLGHPLGDWDLATNLMPQDVMKRVKGRHRAIPTGLQHGTVTVIVDGQTFEVTTYRSDGNYTDGRHPEFVKLGVSLQEDLARRDFTINAMALPVEAISAPNWQDLMVDPFGGREDLKARLIRAVGDPLMRFSEDGLRPLRACRFASQLAFEIERKTLEAIPLRLEVSRKVAVERVLVELTKLLCGADPHRGMQYLADTGLLDLWLPELRSMIGCTQNRHHRYPVWEHTLEVLRLAPPEPSLRWAALFHDSGKPATHFVDEKGEVHFYGHEALSLKHAEMLLRRLKSSAALLEEVLALIRHHGTHPNEKWSDAACRRFLRKLAEDSLSLERWGQFRLADQLGKGWGDEPQIPDMPSLEAWRQGIYEENRRILARLESLAAQQPPLSPKDLALDGRDLMTIAQRPGGPWLGSLQRHLLEIVLEDPALNTVEDLRSQALQWLEANL